MPIGPEGSTVMNTTGPCFILARNSGACGYPVPGHGSM